MKQLITKNEVVYSDKETRKHLLDDAIRISKEGGKYSFKDYFNGHTWITEITIYWPEENDS